MQSITLTQLLLLLMYLQIILCFLQHFQSLQDYPLLWHSLFNFKKSWSLWNLQNLFLAPHISHCTPILHSYMDQFITCILVISLEPVPEGVLTDARTKLCSLILLLSWLTRVTLQTSSRCCIFFFTFHLNFSKHVSIFSKTLTLFHKLNHKEFCSKTGKMDIYFSINPRNFVFSINAKNNHTLSYSLN